MLAEAQLLATNTAPMLAFYDREETAKLVNSHHTITDLTWIAVFDENLDVVAELKTENSQKQRSLEVVGSDLKNNQSVTFYRSHLVVTMPIFVEHEQVGMVILESSLAQIKHNIVIFIAIAASTTLVAIFLSVMFIRLRQEKILAPIFDMSALAARVTDGQQYSLRVPVGEGDNEVTQLSLRFNQMLETIESRDRELKAEILQRRKSEQQLDLLARTDLLTSLPNRLAFNKDLDTAVAQSISTQQQLALVFIDLDNFKPVNDNFGHKVGDAVLQISAKRMVKLLRESDTIYRLGGDEFAAIIYGITEADHAADFSLRITEKIKQSMIIGKEKHEVKIGASLGIAFCPQHGQDTETLLHKADLAMYAAKRQGKGSFKLYENSMDGVL